MTRRKYSEHADHNEVINKLYESIRKLKDENRQLKLALGCYDIDCTYEEFVKSIKRKNQNMAALLDKAKIRRFEQGRIWLSFADLDLQDSTLAQFYLKDFLVLWSVAKFGIPSDIRIKINKK